MFLKQSDQRLGIKFHRWPVRVSCSILNPLKNEFKDSAHTAQWAGLLKDKTNQLMVYREIIAVYSEIHTKHTQRVHSVGRT